ncbi:MAG: AFG1 family ATPase [Gammaproteobacteria bacterium]|nr:AFG1 family ATPase [Gammaproteobacteria bacterium]
MHSASPLAARITAALAAHGHQPDAAQRRAIARLEDLRRRLLARAARPTLLARGLAALAPRRRVTPLRGLYLWGAVGRGKTFLMDQFCAELPLPDKRREHFHRFMQDVHAGLRRHRNRPEPLARVADDLATSTRLLCFDEFVVSDIADAMILGGLLEALFARGVTLVATSNVAPANLYRDGLQRARFLPAIALLERHCLVLELDGPDDYRLRQLERLPTFLGAAVADREQRLAAEFAALAADGATADPRIVIAGRPLRARGATEDIVWFDFDELCVRPRAAADYIELARCYHTVLISGVPALDALADDAARRLITLVDEFYDRGVKLLLSCAAATPDDLYRGQRLAFEFRRTASRLHEMQGREYLARAHRA